MRASNSIRILFTILFLTRFGFGFLLEEALASHLLPRVVPENGDEKAGDGQGGGEPYYTSFNYRVHVNHQATFLFACKREPCVKECKECEGGGTTTVECSVTKQPYTVKRKYYPPFGGPLENCTLNAVPDYTTPGPDRYIEIEDTEGEPGSDNVPEPAFLHSEWTFLQFHLFNFLSLLASGCIWWLRTRSRYEQNYQRIA